MEMQNNSKVSRKKASRPALNAFLGIIFQLLEENRYSTIFSWDSDGTSILVKDVTQFEQVVLKAHFSHQNIASFTRQLNMYNFKKTKRDSSVYEYSNPLFRKGKQGLLYRIQRRPVSRRSGKSVAGIERSTDTLGSEFEPQVSRKQDEIPKDDDKNLAEMKLMIERLIEEKNANYEEFRAVCYEVQELKEQISKLQADHRNLFIALSKQNEQISNLVQQFEIAKNQVPCINTRRDTDPGQNYQFYGEYSTQNKFSSAQQPFEITDDYVGLKESLQSMYCNNNST